MGINKYMPESMTRIQKRAVLTEIRALVDPDDEDGFLEHENDADEKRVSRDLFGLPA